MSCCGIRCEAKIQQHSWTLAEPHWSPTNKPAITGEGVYKVWASPTYASKTVHAFVVGKPAARTGLVVSGGGREGGDEIEIEIKISEKKETKRMKDHDNNKICVMCIDGRLASDPGEGEMQGVERSGRGERGRRCRDVRKKNGFSDQNGRSALCDDTFNIPLHIPSININRPVGVCEI